MGPILFSYSEESLVSSNLNSKLFWFHSAHPNVYTQFYHEIRRLSTFCKITTYSKSLINLTGELFWDFLIVLVLALVSLKLKGSDDFCPVFKLTSSLCKVFATLTHNRFKLFLRKCFYIDVCMYMLFICRNTFQVNKKK